METSGSRGVETGIPSTETGAYPESIRRLQPGPPDSHRRPPGSHPSPCQRPGGADLCPGLLQLNKSLHPGRPTAGAGGVPWLPPITPLPCQWPWGSGPPVPPAPRVVAGTRHPLTSESQAGHRVALLVPLLQVGEAGGSVQPAAQHGSAGRGRRAGRPSAAAGRQRVGRGTSGCGAGPWSAWVPPASARPARGARSRLGQQGALLSAVGGSGVPRHLLPATDQPGGDFPD